MHTIILTTSQSRATLEALLLEKKQAMMDIEVITPIQYAQRLLFRNHIFNNQIITSKTKYLALVETFKKHQLPLLPNVMKAYLKAFEILSDVNLHQHYSFRSFSEQKLTDLITAYKTFKVLCGKEVFETEIYQSAIGLKEENTQYYYLLPLIEMDGLRNFIQSLDAKPFEIYNENPLKTSCKVQFRKQEYEYIFNQINTLVNHGTAYREIAIYVANNQEMINLAQQSIFPLNVEVNTTREHDLAVLTDVDENEAPVTLLDRLSNQTKAALQDVADLDRETFYLLLPFFIPKQETTTLLNKVNRIDVYTYQNPNLSKKYSYTFFANLCEDEFPSKVDNKGLISNEELQCFYGGKSYLDKRNRAEIKLFNSLIKHTQKAYFSCCCEGLDGQPKLPSLLFKTYEKQSTQERFEFQAVPPVPLLIENELQAMPLTQETRDKIYPKHISASALETYNDCPFKHFIRYGLGFKPSKGILERRALYGTLMHDFLDAIAPVFNDGVPFHGDMDQSIEDLFDACSKPLIEKMGLTEIEDQYLLYDFKKKGLNALKLLLHQQEAGDFKMIGHEFPIDLEMDGYRYLGAIDRAELYKDYLKIIDYKSSQKKLELDLCMQGFNIQMLFYLELLSRMTGKEKGAVVYFNTTDPCVNAKVSMEKDMLGSRLDDADLTDARMYIKQRKVESLIVDESNHEILHALDHNYIQSDIYGTRMVKSTGNVQGPLMSKEALDRLINKVFEHLQNNMKLCFEEGDISILPAESKRNKKSPCTYCDYRDVCLRDPFYHQYKEIKYYSKKEIEAMLGGECDESGE